MPFGAFNPLLQMIGNAREDDPTWPMPPTIGSMTPNLPDEYRAAMSMLPKPDMGPPPQDPGFLKLFASFFGDHLTGTSGQTERRLAQTRGERMDRKRQEQRHEEKKFQIMMSGIEAKAKAEKRAAELEDERAHEQARYEQRRRDRQADDVAKAKRDHQIWRDERNFVAQQNEDLRAAADAKAEGERSDKATEEFGNVIAAAYASVRSSRGFPAEIVNRNGDVERTLNTPEDLRTFFMDEIKQIAVTPQHEAVLFAEAATAFTRLTDEPFYDVEWDESENGVTPWPRGGTESPPPPPAPPSPPAAKKPARSQGRRDSTSIRPLRPHAMGLER